VSLAQRLTGLKHLADQAAGEPLGVPVGAVEVADCGGRAPHEVQSEQSAKCPVGAERGHGARVEVDDPGLACLGRAFDPLFVGAIGLHHADAAGRREPAGVQVGVAPRRASASPRRIPVAAGSRQPMARSGSWASAQHRNRASSSGSGCLLGVAITPRLEESSANPRHRLWKTSPGPDFARCAQGEGLQAATSDCSSEKVASPCDCLSRCRQSSI
jgi:hypothetical protein